jgi:hypothetical protein
MHIKITQSFAEIGLAPFRVGEVLTLADDVAKRFIALGRARQLVDNRPKRELAAKSPRREKR